MGEFLDPQVAEIDLCAVVAAGGRLGGNDPRDSAEVGGGSFHGRGAWSHNTTNWMLRRPFSWEPIPRRGQEEAPDGPLDRGRKRLAGRRGGR